ERRRICGDPRDLVRRQRDEPARCVSKYRPVRESERRIHLSWRASVSKHGEVKTGRPMSGRSARVMRWPLVILTFLLTAAAVLYFWHGMAPRPASLYPKQPKPERPEAPAVESGKRPGSEIAPGGRRFG